MKRLLALLIPLLLLAQPVQAQDCVSVEGLPQELLNEACELLPENLANALTLAKQLYSQMGGTLALDGIDLPNIQDLGGYLKSLSNVAGLKIDTQNPTPEMWKQIEEIGNYDSSTIDLITGTADSVKTLEFTQQMMVALALGRRGLEGFNQIKALVDDYLLNGGAGMVSQLSAARSALQGRLITEARTLTTEERANINRMIANIDYQIGNRPYTGILEDVLDPFLNLESPLTQPVEIEPEDRAEMLASLVEIEQKLGNPLLGREARSQLEAARDKINQILSGQAQPMTSEQIAQVLSGYVDDINLQATLKDVLEEKMEDNGFTGGPSFDGSQHDVMDNLINDPNLADYTETQIIDKMKNAVVTYHDMMTTIGDCHVDGEEDGHVEEDEFPDCPEVNCETGGEAFKERVEAFLNYHSNPADAIKAATNNRKTWLDKSLHDYTENYSAERKDEDGKARQPGYYMNPPEDSDGNARSCEDLREDGRVSEPCNLHGDNQDNRHRDMCYHGTTPPDVAYYLTYDESDPENRRKIRGDEEPWPGVRGATSQNIRIGSVAAPFIGCVIPKNTQRISPILLDSGWRYRHMCPGDATLHRVAADQHSIKSDIFRGVFHCFAPLPKCELKNDYPDYKASFGRDWMRKEFKRYTELADAGIRQVTDNPRTDKFDPKYNSVAEAIEGFRELGEREGSNGEAQALRLEAIQRLIDPRNDKEGRSPECKPAFWARLMMDSCANQYISQKAAEPDYVFNADGREFGISPRWCQPFKTKLLKEGEDGEEEYDPLMYLRRSAKHLLVEDYYPTMRYQEAKGVWTKLTTKIDFMETLFNGPEPRIQGLKLKILEPIKGKNGEEDINPFNKTDVSINRWAEHNIERIVDVAHPFSPRYDIAKGNMLFLERTDRTYFPNAGQTLMFYVDEFEGKKIDKCLPVPFTGYFEYSEGDGKSATLQDFDNLDGSDSKPKCTVYCSAVPVDVLSFREQKFSQCMRCQINANTNCMWVEIMANAALGQVTRGCVAFWAIYGVTGIDESKDKAAKCSLLAYYKATERARNGKSTLPICRSLIKDENWPVCNTRFDEEGNESWCKFAKATFATACIDLKDFYEPILFGGNIGQNIKDSVNCIGKTGKDICHDAAKPVYSLNILKIRPKTVYVKTDQPEEFDEDGPFADQESEYHQKWLNGVDGPNKKNLALGEQRPAIGYTFEEYFGKNRPYMRWWDTGRESFQEGDRPDYWCDWGRNDTIVGVGRDANSIHGKKSQVCRFGGGGEVGTSKLVDISVNPSDISDIDLSVNPAGLLDLFKKPKNGCFPNQLYKVLYPSLAGSEWAELKMYQARCFRYHGLNCLCQYEKAFKPMSSEEAAIVAFGGEALGNAIKKIDESGKPLSYTTVKQFMPLGWRGYASTPHMLGKMQTFPLAGSKPLSSGLVKNPDDEGFRGLDGARVGDILVWTTSTEALPHVARVVEANNLYKYKDKEVTAEGDPIHTAEDVPLGNYVVVEDADNGKFPDACGNTSMLGYGPKRHLYRLMDKNNPENSLPEPIRKQHKEQFVSTVFCDDPSLKYCVERNWDKVRIFRPVRAEERSIPLAGTASYIQEALTALKTKSNEDSHDSVGADDSALSCSDKRLEDPNAICND